MNQRAEILDLFAGKKIATQPAFSGLIHVTEDGLKSEGLALHEVHHDAGKLARAAASTYKLTGFPSAVAPLDLYVEAEALGAAVNFYAGEEATLPQLKKMPFASAKEFTAEITHSPDDLTGERTEILNQGRIKTVCDALEKIKQDIGNEAVIGGMIPGPYTLLLLIVNTGNMFIEMKKDPAAVTNALTILASLLAQVGRAYRDAGADFLTIHDMGGSPGFIGPAKYEQFVLPAEKMLIESLPGPRVLSVCGNVDKSINLLATTGAEAISLDQTSDLVAARRALSGCLLFGNLDPVATLLRGDEARVREAAQRAREAGVDAVWPGCDLVPATPAKNLSAMGML